MAKRFDCEDEPNEFMEAPCRCDCGKWFDLSDGYNSCISNNVICRECKENEVAFNCGDRVMFSEDCIINGRKRAEYGDKGHIVNKHGIIGDKTTIKVDGKKYPIHNVPITILEKYNY